jgi:hypothetical protein
MERGSQQLGQSEVINKSTSSVAARHQPLSLPMAGSAPF